MSNINNATVLLATINPLVAAYNHYSTSKTTSMFSNVQQAPSVTSNTKPSTVGGIIAIIAIFALIILFMYYCCKAVYNLTDSVSQTVCYFFFGVFYIYFAILYYGLSGYKFKLVNSSSNTNSRY